MNQRGKKLTASLFRGKIYERKATWKDLQHFFTKEKEEIISEMKSIFTPTEFDNIIAQLEQNELQR